MRRIQAVAIILWVFIFVVAAFVLGQVLYKSGKFDVTTIVESEVQKQKKQKEKDLKEESEEVEDVVINKVGQETIRIGQNIAHDYFEDYYKEYVKYLANNNQEYVGKGKVDITDDMASNYIFYAISNGVDKEKYVFENNGEKVTINEANINTFIDKMFSKSISENYINSDDHNKADKVYNISMSDNIIEANVQLIKIENITSNNVKLSFNCNDNKQNIDLYICYIGGRYIVESIEI